MTSDRPPAPAGLSAAAPPEAAVPRGVITGIPRSGTSHLCGVLHTLPNHVVINEPRAVFAALTAARQPWGLAQLYGDLRRAILAGEAIENKVRDGAVIEDTAVRDAWSLYHPRVSRDDFALWTKNTLAYAARIDGIHEVLPDAPIVALVRHPLDTIASWKTTFPHLREASVEAFPVGSPHDPFVMPQAGERLRRISDCTDLSLRRGLLWAHLAETFLAQGPAVLLTRYEDLMAAPAAVIGDILRRLAHASWDVPLDRLQPRAPRTTKRAILDAADIEAVQTACGETAHRLGYDL